MELPEGLARRYGYHRRRLARCRMIEGQPATNEGRVLYDGRVREYLVWLAAGTAPADPFEAHGESAWVTIRKTLRAYGAHLLVCGVDGAVVDEVLATLENFHRRDRHGGNHLTPESDHWLVTPGGYPRVKELPPDREKRGPRQRERVRIVAAWARERGELHPKEHAWLTTVLDESDEVLAPTWWGLDYLGRQAGGYSASTACRWMGRLVQKGWLVRQHRGNVEKGRFKGTSNVWRVDIPVHLRVEMAQAERDKAQRTRAEKSAGKKGRYTPPAPASADDNELAPWADPEEWAAVSAANARRAAEERKTAERLSARGQAVLEEDARKAAAGRERDPAVVANAARAAEVRARLRARATGRDPERAPP